MPASHEQQGKIRVLETNDKWPYPAHLDGLVLAHNALRRDMRDILQATQTLHKQVNSGTALEAWQVTGLQRYWHAYHAHVKEHHSIEEERFFPFVEQRARMPLLFSEQHGVLGDSLDLCDAAIAKMAATGAAARDAQLLTAFMGPYADMKVLMEEHFAGEERVGLPIFRAHFALKEYQPLQDAINASLSPSHQASFFHAMSSDTRAEFCRLHHIPKVTLVMTILPGMRSFDKTLHKPLLAIINGRRQAPSAGCGCFG